MKNNLDWTEIDLEALPEDFVPRTSYQRSVGEAEFDAGYGRWTSEDGGLTPVRRFYRIIWRQMAAVTGQRTLHISIIPPGATHISFAGGGVDNCTLAVVSGLWSSIVVDFLVKATGIANLHVSFINRLPATNDGRISSEIRGRIARLICLTREYEEFWTEVVGTEWTCSSTARTARDRRQVLVELDALAALAFGLTSDELCTIYRAQFPVLVGYERNDLYDANGRKVPGEMNKLYRQRGEDLTFEDRTWTHPQSEVEYIFEFPFVSYDREQDMRKAYARFEKLLAEKS